MVASPVGAHKGFIFADADADEDELLVIVLNFVHGIGARVSLERKNNAISKLFFFRI